MKQFWILSAFLLAINTSSAMDDPDYLERGSTSKTIVSDDNDPDCIGTCDTSCKVIGRCFWGISAGWFKGVHMLSAAAKLGITPLATFGNFDAQTRQAIGIAAVTLSIISLAAGKFYDFSVIRTIQEQKALKQIEKAKETLSLKIAEIEEPIQMKPLKLKRKKKSTRKAILTESNSDEELPPIETVENFAVTQLKMHYTQLSNQQRKLTDLTPFEQNYYKCAGCFWNNTVTTFIILEFLAGTVESVITGLATIASDGASNTLATITVVLVAVTTLSIFMKEAAQAAALERSRDFVRKIHEAGV